MRRTASFAHVESELPLSPARAATPSPPLRSSPGPSLTMKRAVSFTTLADLPQLPPAMMSPREHLVIKLASRKACDVPPTAPRLRPTGCAADLADLEPLSLEPMLLAPSYMLQPTPELRPLPSPMDEIEALVLPAAVLASHPACRPARCSYSPLTPRRGLRPSPAAAASLMHHPGIREQPCAPGPLLDQMRMDAAMAPTIAAL